MGTYNTPKTLLVIDWNSSSVYSRVGNGAIRMLAGLNCIKGAFREDNSFSEGTEPSPINPMSDCCAAKMIKESNIC